MSQHLSDFCGGIFLYRVLVAIRELLEKSPPYSTDMGIVKRLPCRKVDSCSHHYCPIAFLLQVHIQCVNAESALVPPIFSFPH